MVPSRPTTTAPSASQRDSAASSAYPPERQAWPPTLRCRSPGPWPRSMARCGATPGDLAHARRHRRLQRLSPISVAPPWTMRSPMLEREINATVLRVTIVADITRISVDGGRRSREAAERLRDTARGRGVASTSPRSAATLVERGVAYRWSDSDTEPSTILERFGRTSRAISKPA